MSSSSQKKRVVIIGNGMGGSILAAKLSKDLNLNVKVITPFPFSEIALRMTEVIASGPEEHEKALYPLLKEDNVEYIIGKVTKLQNNVVTLSSGQIIDFDYAVIATGLNVPYFQMDPDINTISERKAQISDLHSKIVKADTILISGGGAIGTELSADIKIRYPSKRILLAFNESLVLSRMHSKLSEAANFRLREIGIELLPRERVQEFSNGKAKLSSGKELNADLYIPAHAGYANTSFMQKEFLDERGFVKVDDYLSVIGMSNVFALGDVSNRDNNKAAIKIDDQVPTIAHNISASASSKSMKKHVFGFMGKVKGPAIVSLGHGHKDAYGIGPDLPGWISYLVWFFFLGPPVGKSVANMKSNFNKTVYPKKGLGIRS